MEKERQVKLLSIVALVLAISAMTLGFAAFSTTLNISSSATVTPNATDFKITVYGLDEEATEKEYNEYTLDSSLYTSSSEVKPILGGTWNGLLPPTSSTNGLITSTSNNNIIISNISVTFSKPSEQAIYPMIISNTGEYDAYVSQKILGEKVCTAAEGEMTSLMEDVCQSVEMQFEIYTSDGDEIALEKSYILEKNKYIYSHIVIKYDNTTYKYADGSFDITFPDIQINFSTAQ